MLVQLVLCLPLKHLLQGDHRKIAPVCLETSNDLLTHLSICQNVVSSCQVEGIQKGYAFEGGLPLLAGLFAQIPENHDRSLLN